LRSLLPVLAFTTLAACAAGSTPSTTAAIATDAPRYPFPQHLTYARSTLRPSRRSQAQQDDDVRAFYDRWKARYLVAAGTGSDGSALYRVSFGSGQPDRTVSEGQGYGMVIVALMAGYDPQARPELDGLYRFFRAHPSHVDSRLMAWEVPEKPPGVDSAFDGDADIAFGLLLADRQWGHSGAIDYADAARQVIAGILASTIGPQSRLPMLGDWTEPGGVQYNQYTPRSSDFMPDHFRAFGRFTADPVWNQVVARSQSAVSQLQSHFSQHTGLLPDFAVQAPASHAPRPAPAGFLEGPNDGAYSYNACRDPWRIASDGLLNDDAVSLEQARRMARWSHSSTGGDPHRIRPGYHLDGSPIPPGDYFTSAFAAPLGVAAMTDRSLQVWLDDVYDAVRTDFEDYYEDSLTLQSMLVMTGNAWDPTTVR
jgi:hypothetical protein